VNCLSYQAWEGWLCLRWFWARKLEHTNRGRRGMLGCRKREPGAPFIGEAGRPGPTGLGGFMPLTGSVFIQYDHFSSVTFLPACSTSCTAQTLSSTPFLHYWSFHLMLHALSHVHVLGGGYPKIRIRSPNTREECTQTFKSQLQMK
jgi:hypothetical protein